MLWQICTLLSSSLITPSEALSSRAIRRKFRFSTQLPKRFEARAVEATELSIIPLAFACSAKQLFSSWDRFMAPYPFSRGLFLYGKSIFVLREGDDFALEEHRLALETELNQLTEEAERAVLE
jgi:hypothetical protein